MYSTLFITTFVFALLALHVRADFLVPTIALTQCEPATLSWDPAKPPYNLIIVSSSDPCGNAIVDFGDHDNNTVGWPKVNITAGTQVMISVMDADDQEGWSGSITVEPSNDTSCLTPQGTPGYYSSPKPPTPSPTTTTDSPAATVIGAANSGLVPNGSCMIHLSSLAVAFTALGALAALL